MFKDFGIIKMNDELKNKQIKKKIVKYINFLKLNLSGLKIYTEVGSGNYLYTPIIASIAGARKTYAIVNDSKYGRKEKIKKDIELVMRQFNINNIEVVFEKKESDLEQCDIITNSGFVRPIDKETIMSLKNTAVIPLMWETWEFRPEEIDIFECKKKNILVLGTNEHNSSLRITEAAGFLLCKVLFDAGRSVFRDKILLISSGAMGDLFSDFLDRNFIDYDRLNFDNNLQRKHSNSVKTIEVVLQSIAQYDVIVVAEHIFNHDLMSDNGIIRCNLLSKENPFVNVVHICGNVNINDIKKHNIMIYPNNPAPFGYMTVTADTFDPESVIELNTAGLKVGEVMARCRLNNMSIKDTINYTLKNSPAMDFEGGFLNL